MTTLISVLLVLSIVVPFGIYFKSEKSKKSGKESGEKNRQKGRE